MSGQRLVQRADLMELPLQVAPRLLGATLMTVVDGVETHLRVTEVEAYHGKGTGDVPDPGSHARMGPTARNATMWGEPGHLYVYFSYGMHHCANVVTGADGDGQAVLLRALTPLRGIDVMTARRHGRTAHLADGPGKLCQALGVDRSHTGMDLCAGGEVRLVDDGTPPPSVVVTTPRIGITKAVDLPWRFLAPP